MSQQINLYVQVRRAAGFTFGRGMLALGVIALALGAWWASLQAQVTNLQDLVSKGEAQAAPVKAALQAEKKRLAAREDVSKVVAEINQLKGPAAESQEVLSRIRKSELGAADGYMAQVVALARVSEEGVWVTALRIGGGGKTIAVEGKALRSESILRYARRLNEQFLPLGAQFTSLEMTPVAVINTSAGRSPPGEISFKLF